MKEEKTKKEKIKQINKRINKFRTIKIFLVIFTLAVLFLFSLFVLIQNQYNQYDRYDKYNQYDITGKITDKITGEIALSGQHLKETIEFKPNLEKIFNYKAINNADKAMNYKINIGGNFANYFESSLDEFSLESHETKSFDITMKLPNTMQPGFYPTYICIQEKSNLTNTSSSNSASSSIITEVCAIINILVLQEQSYLKVNEFEIKENEDNNKIEFSVTLVNYGKEETSAEAYIIIYEKENMTNQIAKEQIAKATTDRKQFLTSREETLTAFYDVKKLNETKYLAEAIIAYDNKTTKTEKEFVVGEPLKIISYTTQIGEEGPIRITLQNNYDYDIEAYTETNISQFGRKIQTIMSAKEFIESNENKILDVPLTFLSPGEYDIEIKVFYLDKLISKTGKLKVVEEEMPQTSGYPFIFWLSLIIAVVVLLLFILFFTKELRKNKR